jgi:4'-phosphopantetheinyl transferase
VKIVAENEAAVGMRPWLTEAEFIPQRLPLGRLTVPTEPTVHLWHLDLGNLWKTLSSALGEEGGDNTEHNHAMTMPQLRFARRFYLRMLLGAYLGVAGKDVALARGARGKPVLDVSRHGRNLHFSLAKSGQRVLIGISAESEVGVDLELKDRKPRNTPSLAKRFFTQREAQAICELDQAQRDAEFMRIWACKEAVAKASGHGIANRFCRFSVQATANSKPVVVEDPDHPVENWRLALVVPERDYLAAVAVRRSALELEGFRIHAD